MVTGSLALGCAERGGILLQLELCLCRLGRLWLVVQMAGLLLGHLLGLGLINFVLSLHRFS